VKKMDEEFENQLKELDKKIAEETKKEKSIPSCLNCCR